MTKWRKIASISLLTLSVLGIVYYIYTHLEDFSRLSLVKPSNIGIMVLLVVLTSTCMGLQLKYLLKPFGVILRPMEWFGLSEITSFYNIITPFKGGAIARAAYLKLKHNFPYTQFLSTLSGGLVIMFFIQSFIGITSMLFLYLTDRIFNVYVFIIFLAFFLPLLIIIMVSPKLPEHRNRLINNIVQIINGWHQIRSHRREIVIIILASLVQLCLNAFGTIITFAIIGVHLTFIKALFMASLAALSIVVSITPSGFGIGETVSVFSGLAIGITPAHSLTASIIGRVIYTSVILVLGPVFSYFLLREKESGKRTGTALP